MKASGAFFDAAWTKARIRPLLLQKSSEMEMAQNPIYDFCALHFYSDAQRTFFFALPPVSNLFRKSQGAFVRIS